MKTKKATPCGATLKQSNSTTKEKILSILSKRKRGYSRYELSQRLGVTDAVMRQAIADLRDEGYMVGTRADGGYSLNNEEDFDRAIALIVARRNTASKRIKNMKRTLEMKGQVTLL